MSGFEDESTVSKRRCPQWVMHQRCSSLRVWSLCEVMNGGVTFVFVAGSCGCVALGEREEM